MKLEIHLFQFTYKDFPLKLGREVGREKKQLAQRISLAS